MHVYKGLGDVSDAKKFNSASSQTGQAVSLINCAYGSSSPASFCHGVGEDKKGIFWDLARSPQLAEKRDALKDYVCGLFEGFGPVLAPLLIVLSWSGEDKKDTSKGVRSSGI